MGLALAGISVSKGIAIGKAHLLKRDELEISEFIVPKPLISEEVARFRAAMKKTQHQLKNVRKRIASHASAEIAGFVDAHLLMLKDSILADEPVRIIKKKRCNAEWALKIQRDMLVDAFEQMDDPYLSARLDDVKYVIERVLRNLLEQPDPMQHEHERWLKGGVVVADEVSADDMVIMHQQGVVALITEFGGANSHTAILARSLGIPALVGVKNVRRYLQQQELLIVDGQNGVVLAAPDKDEIEYYRLRQRDEKRRLLELEALREQTAVTHDGHAISLQVNMELEADLVQVLHANAAGVGLLRTEVLFMNRQSLPTEEEQFDFYRQVVQALQGAPVTIRTLDIGADKQLDYLGSNSKQTNPALGLRAVRLCLRDKNIFISQLRAILRASNYGPVRIMIPLLTTLDELFQVKELIEDVKAALDREAVPYASNIPLGGMVEVPAVAIMADVFAAHLDFLSIGTNDLIQYTLAADRMDDEVNYLFDPLHPAVLRLIHTTIQAAEKHSISVSMCGEMAGDPRYTRLLLGLGLREFSMHPASLLEIKRIVRDSDLAELRHHCASIVDLGRALEVDQRLAQINTLRLAPAS